MPKKKRKPDRRYNASVYLTDQERELIRAAAQADGRAFSEFIRHAVLTIARRRVPTPPPPQEASHD
jgi:uncharacterized protein (DUF1778 family)